MKKMNVNELKSLSRTEMKNIMAGSGERQCACIPLQYQCVSPFEWGSCQLGSGSVGHLCCSI